MNEFVRERADGTQPAAGKMRVLVAEDNPVFQSMLRRMLSKWGYEVVTALDGEQIGRAHV